MHWNLTRIWCIDSVETTCKACIVYRSKPHEKLWVCEINGFLYFFTYITLKPEPYYIYKYIYVLYLCVCVCGYICVCRCVYVCLSYSCHDTWEFNAFRDLPATLDQSPVIKSQSPPREPRPPVFTNRKIKVLFAFTCAGRWSEAECQAAPSCTAAWSCARTTEINDVLYTG